MRTVPPVIADLRTQRARDSSDDSTLKIDSSLSVTRPKTTHVPAAVCSVSLGSHAVSSNSPVRFLHPRYPPTSFPATGSPERSRPDCDPALRRARQLSVHSVLHLQASNTRRPEYPSRSSSRPETLHAAASTSTGARGSLSLAHLHNRARSEHHLGFPLHRGRAIAPVASQAFLPCSGSRYSAALSPLYDDGRPSYSRRSKPTRSTPGIDPSAPLVIIRLRRGQPAGNTWYAVVTFAPKQIRPHYAPLLLPVSPTISPTPLVLGPPLFFWQPPRRGTSQGRGTRHNRYREPPQIRQEGAFLSRRLCWGGPYGSLPTSTLFAAPAEGHDGN